MNFEHKLLVLGAKAREAGQGTFHSVKIDCQDGVDQHDIRIELKTNLNNICPAIIIRQGDQALANSDRLIDKTVRYSGW